MYSAIHTHARASLRSSVYVYAYTSTRKDGRVAEYDRKENARMRAEIYARVLLMQTSENGKVSFVEIRRKPILAGSRAKTV